jgi:cobalt-zinc-cadmium efflux system outer membrane protein
MFPMRKSLAIFSLSAMLLLGGCATPAPPMWKPLSPADLSHPLSLAECLNLARRNDIQAAQWQARLATARAELTGARTLPNPTFQASWEDLGVKDAAGASLGNSTYGLSYPIFFWWTRGPEIAAARNKLRAEEASVRADQRQLAIDVGAAYLTLLAAERKEQAQQDMLKEARDALRLAEESFKLGSVAGHDVDLARTEARQAEAELFDARRDEQAQSLAFAFALGADRPMPARIQDAPPSMPLAIAQVVAQAATTTTLNAAAPLLPGALLSQAQAADPACAKAKADRKAAEAQFQIEARRVLPLADAQVGAARKNDPEGMGHNFSFEIPIPLFDWNQGGMRKARAELLAAQADEEKARREIVSQLSVAWQSYVNAKQRYESYALRIAQDRALLAGDAQDLFAAGQIGYSELLQARREWRQAELAAVDSWRESMISAWEILCRIGDNDSQSLDAGKKTNKDRIRKNASR